MLIDTLWSKYLIIQTEKEMFKKKVCVDVIHTLTFKLQ